MKSRSQTQIILIIRAVELLSPSDPIIRSLLAELPPKTQRALRRYLKELLHDQKN